jgi:putative glutamine amidotransferase
VLVPGTRVPDAVRTNLDGLLLTGGGDVAAEHFGGSDGDARDVDADRDDGDRPRAALPRRAHPVLGMCRGNQVLNVALGGTLRTVEGHVQTEPLTAPVQQVAVDAGCRLERVLGRDEVAVNSFHRWAVGEPAPGMAVTVRTPDEVAEGIEWTNDDWFAIGTQWHGELMDTPHVAAMFGAFVEAARQRSAR